MFEAYALLIAAGLAVFVRRAPEQVRGDGQGIGAGDGSVNPAHRTVALSGCCRELERRKPRLLLRLPGSLLLRIADRQFCASLFQLPPRITRLEPLVPLAC